MPIRLSRRALLTGATAASLVPEMAAANGNHDSWAPAVAILKRIKAPVFPSRDFDIRDHGASPDDPGRTTGAIADAITACSAAGGGRVVVPAGRWPTGAVVLKSNVNLHLADGATLAFSQNPADYPVVLTRFEGVECMNYSPFIYAFGQSNIAITGRGTLDGQADGAHWWDWARNAREAIKRLGDMAAQGIPPEKRVFGGDWKLRPNFIQPYRCRNVLIEDVTIVGSPMWEIHPVLSCNITVRGVHIDSQGPNNDGCDPESCADVLIEHVIFNTGDDCIAIKSGRNQDGRRVGTPSENIVIRNCRMVGGHGGVSLGSEASGGIRNIYVRDCQMGSPTLDRALRLKSNSYRGGYIENVVFRDVTIDHVAEDIMQVTLDYGEGRSGAYNPRIGHIRLENVVCGKTRRAFDIAGYPDDIITAIDIRDCVFDAVAKPSFIANAEVRANNVRLNGSPWQPVMATPEEEARHGPGGNSAK